MEENSSGEFVEKKAGNDAEHPETEVNSLSKLKCIHCQTEIEIQPPYTVGWQSTAWINCPNKKCRRPNKFLFINGGNVSVTNITKFKSAPVFLSASDNDDIELGNLMREVEDSHIHDRNKGAAIVLRVCLEQFIWVRTLHKEPLDANTGIGALTELKQYLLNNNRKENEIRESRDAFNFIADLGDTAAHYRLRNNRRVKLATESNVALAIRKFDKLNEIINGGGV